MRIVIADDQSDVRSALRLLLDQEPNLTVSCEVSDCDGLRQALETRSHDLVLLDWELSGCRTEKLVSQLRAQYPDLAIIALSNQPEARRKAIDAGADDFISKGSYPQKVVETLQKCRHR